VIGTVGENINSQPLTEIGTSIGWIASNLVASNKLLVWNHGGCRDLRAPIKPRNGSRQLGANSVANGVAHRALCVCLTLHTGSY
jgi:hypothetical protein